MSAVARLNFKTSRVGVYKWFTSLSEIERNFFVFVGILEKGMAIRCIRKPLQLCNFSANILRIEHLYIGAKLCRAALEECSATYRIDFFCHLTQCEQVFMGTITNSFSAVWSNLVRMASLRNGRRGVVPVGDNHGPKRKIPY